MPTNDPGSTAITPASPTRSCRWSIATRGAGSKLQRSRSSKSEAAVDDISARRLHERPQTNEKPWGLLILLMAMTAIGPTTLNILVPALPQLSLRLGADIAVVQLTVSVYLLALAAGQLVMGPLSDRFGRRPVLLSGLALTAAA